MSEGMESSTFNYSVFDQELATGIRQFDVPLFEAYLANYLSHPLLELANQWKARSMLAVQSLLLMRAFALQSKGAITEIGTWYGRRGPGFASFVDEGRRDERRRLGLTPE